MGEIMMREKGAGGCKKDGDIHDEQPEIRIYRKTADDSGGF